MTTISKKLMAVMATAALALVGLAACSSESSATIGEYTVPKSVESLSKTSVPEPISLTVGRGEENGDAVSCYSGTDNEMKCEYSSFGEPSVNLYTGEIPATSEDFFEISAENIGEVFGTKDLTDLYFFVTYKDSNGEGKCFWIPNDKLKNEEDECKRRGIG